MIICVDLFVDVGYRSYQTVFRLVLVLAAKLEQQLSVSLSHMAMEAYYSRDITILCKVW